MKTKISIYSIVFLLLLTSCSPAAVEPTATPVNIAAIQTEAVATFSAEVTQIAAAFTATPVPTETLTPTPPAPTVTPTPDISGGTPTEGSCDNLEFISDVTVPDNSIKAAGEEFIKTWKVKNPGPCTWTTGYSIIYGYGERLNGQTTALAAEVLPNTEADISITLKAPSAPGTYSSYWRLANNNGSAFGTFLTVVIIVQ